MGRSNLKRLQFFLKIALIFNFLLVLSVFFSRSDTVRRYGKNSVINWSSMIFGGKVEKPNAVQAVQDFVKDRFQQRLTTLQQVCRQYGNSSMFRPYYRKLIRLQAMASHQSISYCPIQKTGSTTWKETLNSIQKRHLHPGYRLNATRNITKEIVFTFVREPYSRLLSAYVDKFFSPNPMFWHRVGTYIVKRFRKNPLEISLRCGHDVTFPEFVKYVIHSQKTGRHRDGHFVPAHDHCQMCRLPYQYIGHLETISEDMPYILQQMEWSGNYTRQVFDKRTLKRNSNLVLNVYRQKIKQCMTLELACRRLWKKWLVRGIIDKQELFPLSEPEAQNVSVEAFQKVALAALERSAHKSSRILQKQEALREAFTSVPLSDRLTLQDVLFLDFKLFGFDPSPEGLSLEKQYKPSGNFSYFEP